MRASIAAAAFLASCSSTPDTSSAKTPAGSYETPAVTALRQSDRLPKSGTAAPAAPAKPAGKTSVMQLLARDRTLLDDPKRLEAMTQGTGEKTEQRTTEYTPYSPGAAQSLNHNKLMGEGWKIANVSWEPKKKVYVINWVRTVPEAAPSRSDK